MSLSSVGFKLDEVARILKEREVKFTVCRTHPTRNFFQTDESDLRVAREQTAADADAR